MEALNEKGGLGLGARRITISTVGLPEKIRELARYGKPFNLAVSLHAPNDELRNRLVPVNDRIGIGGDSRGDRRLFSRHGPPRDVRVRAARRAQRQRGTRHGNWPPCSKAAVRMSI